MILKNIKIAIIGLGYVGLPLAIEFGRKYHTIGFDSSSSRIAELNNGYDRTLEVSREALANTPLLSYTNHIDSTKTCNIYIIAVPTPINQYNQPDLNPLKKASAIVGNVMQTGGLIIYESTVYPGVTEEICVPILEQTSGLSLNQNFFVGYSPERANTGDKVHSLTNVVKITSGSTKATADKVDKLYKSIIKAGTHKASSIKIAEAAKIIENVQRDVNIALINELALIFNRLDIDTESVIQAAETKWNFSAFRPGLVGGHCLGIDPYYLTYKAQSIGYNPEIILSSRRVNDSMGKYVASQLLTLMTNKSIKVKQANVLIMGITFKENCPDVRNTRVVDIIKELNANAVSVHIYDPWVDSTQAVAECGIKPITVLPENTFDAIVLAVAHTQFKQMNIHKIRALGKSSAVVYDLKSLFPADLTDARL